MAYVHIDIRFKLITCQNLIYATFTVNGSTGGGIRIDTPMPTISNVQKRRGRRFSFVEMQVAVVTARYRL